jgi:Kef-type K+ transport system membrane component KefB/mannitol/fructose-specific phosphotransferase system IIA component (Ntr-type)
MTPEQVTHVLDESHILLFLVQFLLLLGSAKLLGILFTRIRQPTVTADILVGVILGPSILGRVAPGLHQMLFPADPLQVTMLDTLAWLGIFFLLLVTGLEVNFSSVWKHKGNALRIALADIIVPILISALVLYFLPSRYLADPNRRLLFTLFLSTIMTISAMPVSIRVMRDLKLLKTDMGFLTVSALSINDVIGWVVFTIILGIFTYGTPELGFVAGLVFATVAFMALAFTIGRRVLDVAITAVKERTSDASGYSLTVVCLAGLAFGAITQRIGIHALFGFFVAGLIAGEAKDLSELTRTTITKIVYAVFVPVFFANIGLKVDLLGNFDLGLVLLFTALGIVARFAGAYLGAVLARIPRAQRWPVGALHTPGGEMHIVIATLALDLRLIDDIVFVAIVVAAVLSSVTLGPWLSFIMKRMVPAEALQVERAASLELPITDKQEALRELSLTASGMVGLDAEELYQAARQREDAMSTGLEAGIAIPHVRDPRIQRSVTLFGRSSAGIDWNSPDGRPARLIFLILTPLDEADTQLRVYRQLLRVLSHDETRTALQRAPTIDEARNELNRELRLLFITSAR